MRKLDRNIVSQFLKSNPSDSMHYPDVAAMVAEWIGNGEWWNMDDLVKRTWAQTKNLLFPF